MSFTREEMDAIVGRFKGKENTNELAIYVGVMIIASYCCPSNALCGVNPETIRLYEAMYPNKQRTRFTMLREHR